MMRDEKALKEAKNTITNMVECGITMGGLPNIAISESLSDKSKDIAIFYEDILTEHLVISAISRINNYYAEMPNVPVKDKMLSQFYQAFSFSSAFQNRFYGIGTISMQRFTEEIESEIINGLMSFILNNCDNAKFILSNVSDSVMKEIKKAYPLFIFIEKESENNRDEAKNFIKNYAIKVNANLSPKRIKEITDYISLKEKKEWLKSVETYIHAIHSGRRDIKNTVDNNLKNILSDKKIGF